MNIEFAEVILWGNRIGIVSFDPKDGYTRFEYDKDFIQSGIEISPIMMPLNNAVYSFPTLNKETFKGLPGLLSESLPDKFGDKVVEAYYKSQGRSLKDLSPIERLCYTGKRGMGALEYIPSTGPKTDKQETIQINKMVDLASQVLNNRKTLKLKKDDANYINLLKFSTSAGGARAKATVAYNKKTKRFFSGQIANKKDCNYYIIKFDEVNNNGDYGIKDSKGYTRVEYAYYLMARKAHINMNECFLYKEGNMRHFMTLRFDRQDKTGNKIHMLSLGGIGHFDYKQPRTCSYEIAASICSRINIGNDEIQELYRRMVFNVIAINNDDHVKNISFLMDKKGKWSLAPAYDITFAYKSNNQWLAEHQMLINGKSKDITYEDLLASASSMNISKAKAISIIKEVIDSVSKWDEFASEAEVFKEDQKTIGSMLKNSISPFINK